MPRGVISRLVQSNVPKILVVVIYSSRSRSVPQINLGCRVDVASVVRLLQIRFVLDVLQGEHVLWAVQVAVDFGTMLQFDHHHRQFPSQNVMLSSANQLAIADNLPPPRLYHQPRHSLHALLTLKLTEFVAGESEMPSFKYVGFSKLTPCVPPVGGLAARLCFR